MSLNAVFLGVKEDEYDVNGFFYWSLFGNETSTKLLPGNSQLCEVQVPGNSFDMCPL